MNKFSHFVKTSIATQLFSVVFTFYCVIAIAITLTQVLIEYEHTQDTIHEELSSNQAIFAPLIANALWDLEESNILNTLNAMLLVPIIKGVKVEQDNQISYAVGSVMTDDKSTLFYDAQGKPLNNQSISANLFNISFAANYYFRDEPRNMGKITIYSNSSVVIGRVKFGVILLIVNAIIKSAALWLLFYWFGNKILLQPLRKLIIEIEKVNFSQLDEINIDLNNTTDNELNRIQEAFNDMFRHLADAKIEIIKSHLQLENKVKLRTKELNIAKIQAEMANKAKTEFMSHISHELNTPLNAIIGGSQVMKYKVEDDKDTKVLVDNVHTAGLHLSMLVTDIIDMLENNNNDSVRVNLQWCCLDLIIESCIEMIKPLADSKNITILYDKHPIQVMVDDGRMRQIILNLLTNAIQYNKDNGIVEISSEMFSDHRVELSIKDSGIGIDGSDLDTIFLPFVRLEYAKLNCIDGMGIGLSIVRNLIDKMNLKMSVNSCLKEGTNFKIFLNQFDK